MNAVTVQPNETYVIYGLGGKTHWGCVETTSTICGGRRRSIWGVHEAYDKILTCQRCIDKVGTLTPAIDLRMCHCGKDGHPLGSVNCPEHGTVSLTAEVARLQTIVNRAWAAIGPVPAPAVSREVLERELVTARTILQEGLEP